MLLTRRPVRNMLLRRDFDRFFNDSLLSNFENKESGNLSFSPAIDIHEDDNNIVINCDLPGMEKKDIEVDLKDNILSIKGKRSYENEVKKENFYRKERSFGSFSRSFNVSNSVDPEKIEASFENGVLKVTLPKKEEKKPKQISIN